MTIDAFVKEDSGANVISANVEQTEHNGKNTWIFFKSEDSIVFRYEIM